ncbi:hypothetical protein H4F18_00005, partial [Vibrio scophthalmi]|uniref:Ig-like domain-containing protein n=1 Tax=Vibrio scophthalmi TaxID=45658 RepID=UPI002FF08791
MSFVTHALIGNLAGGQIIVIDKNGNVRVVNEGEQLLPGEVVISGDASLVESATNPEVSVNLVQDSGDLTDITGEIDAIFAALEEGVDPTQLGDEFATAAGGTSGSSLTPTGTIERDGVESIASTNFVTTGFQSAGLSETQSLAFQSVLTSPISPTESDTTAPSAPQITLDVDSGISSTDFLTNDGSYTVSGIEAGATVEYLVNGEWTTTPPTATEGENTITVRQTDAAGNTSESSTLSFTLDTVAT